MSKKISTVLVLMSALMMGAASQSFAQAPCAPSYEADCYGTCDVSCAPVCDVPSCAPVCDVPSCDVPSCDIGCGVGCYGDDGCCGACEFDCCGGCCAPCCGFGVASFVCDVISFALTPVHWVAGLLSCGTFADCGCAPAFDRCYSDPCDCCGNWAGDCGYGDCGCQSCYGGCEGNCSGEYQYSGAYFTQNNAAKNAQNNKIVAQTQPKANQSFSGSNPFANYPKTRAARMMMNASPSAQYTVAQASRNKNTMMKNRAQNYQNAPVMNAQTSYVYEEQVVGQPMRGQNIQKTAANFNMQKNRRAVRQAPGQRVQYNQNQRGYQY